MQLTKHLSWDSEIAITIFMLLLSVKDGCWIVRYRFIVNLIVAVYKTYYNTRKKSLLELRNCNCTFMLLVAGKDTKVL